MNPTQGLKQIPSVDEAAIATAGPRRRPFALGKVDLLLAVLGLLVILGAYWTNFLPEALALLVLPVALVTVVLRARHARRDPLNYGLLRHPFRRELRPFLLQCLNHWLFWSLFGAAILAGTFALVPAQIVSALALPLPLRVPYWPLLISLGLAAVMMAALALVPRRRVQIATNVLVAVGSVFLAVQLVRVHVPPAAPVAVGLPLAGEWKTTGGGRSLLLSHHFTNKTGYVKDAVDFVRFVDGRAYDGDPKLPESWYSWGQPVLAPAEGTVVSVDNVHPDEPLGKPGALPPHGNHIVIDLGDDRYAVLAHLKQGSVQVSEGERVRPGQLIAAVGDSGNSLWPHLHFHVQDSPNLDTQTRTVPIVFRNTVLTRNGRVSTPAAADLRRGDDVVANERDVP